ncbi:branched-chain amino acid ABC transporter permease [Biomaibacter acetigenes]|jgi:branched-chain amino acid transport system permease protein|uniref:Branched-chain amino acid ABC transporter permease n=1 Tax=Biomaibacter acetigenes TaxID=2316383 RepID=A0A3G2RA18_9FIRM|nr:branched-chain amino acid ABC transporter permease [Biomaibacter acetigenes]AYO31868.1 branched-chain amino acid ABC transporter permease [Biomaibacter acetigenes]
MQYLEGIIILICINLMVVVGLSLLTGFTGLFSFGHAAYMAIGAYTSALITTKLGVPFFVGIIAGAIVAGLAGWLIGTATLKLVGDYFAIASLGFGETIRLLLDNGGKVTGGARGFGGIPYQTTLLIAVTVAFLAVVVMRNIILSRYGRSFMAIREDEIAAQACGIDTFSFKKKSLVISAVYAGIGGSLFAHYMNYLQPIMFDMAKSTEVASAVVFGGLGSLTGSILASIILTGVPELLRPLFQWRLVFYGLVLVGTIVLRPQGIMGGKEISFVGLKKVFRFRLKEENSNNAHSGNK